MSDDEGLCVRFRAVICDVMWCDDGSCQCVSVCQRSGHREITVDLER